MCYLAYYGIMNCSMFYGYCSIFIYYIYILSSVVVLWFYVFFG